MQKVDKIWLDGKMVPWDAAQVHVLTHTLHYGLGVFEGIRCYELSSGGSAIFQLKAHIDRLFDSAHILMMEMPFDRATIVQACKSVMKDNKLKHGYIRPIAFLGDGEMGLAASNTTRVAVAAWPWGTYLGDEGVKNGIRAKISSFTRHHVNATLNKAKTCATYVNSILAKREAIKGGYEEAILLDTEGYVAEATGENIFMAKGGRVKTTPSGASILNGITAASVRKVLADLNIEVIEEKFTRDELYLADEVFLTGTAAEITPIREIDDRKIGVGKPGPITKQVQQTFFNIVRGKNSKYSDWLDKV